MSTVTLRPDAAGEVAQLAPSGEASNYLCVDEEVTDEDVTLVYTFDADWKRDLYGLEDTESTEPVYCVGVYARCYAGSTPGQTSLKIIVKTGGIVYEGGEETLVWDWADYTRAWYTSPASGLGWTKEDLDALQIGVSLRQCRTTGTAASKLSACTQIYAEVEYTEERYSLSSLLYSRELTTTLQDRSLVVPLRNRSLVMTLSNRDLVVALPSRSLSVTIGD